MHFTNPGWEHVYAYFFDANAIGAAWPGNEIYWSYNNDFGEGVYTVTVPAGARYVIFNNNNETQTVDIELTGVDKGYYISGGSGKACTVGTWDP